MSDTSSVLLTPAGSNRRYYREIGPDGTSYIRVEGTSCEENHAFIVMARYFLKKGLPVPQIYSVSEDEMTYTQQDLGNTLLFDYIASGRQSGNFSDEEVSLLRRTLCTLAHFQTDGAEGLDWSVCYPVDKFDQRTIDWDLNYWKYCFLKGTGIEFSETLLEDDFERLSRTLLDNTIVGFMYRDFQSRNVMLVQQSGILYPYFIDFQGGRKGPIQYDIASFLWQAKANFSNALRAELIDSYLDELSTIYQHKGQQLDVEFFQTSLPHFVLFRTLQVLGAYGYRGYFERKPHFLESIPFALRNLCQLFEQYPHLHTAYPYIYKVSERLGAHEASVLPGSEIAQRADNHAEETALEVTIYSFSYRKGIPEDASGNGGGYVFDCRSTHNPGKYAQYKTLTGLDQPVIDFLEQDGEITRFLEHTFALVDHHVERYLERGFTHLQIAFGCTGGQHRSVYSAEAMARHISERFADRNIRISLIHREQNIHRAL